MQIYLINLRRIKQGLYSLMILVLAISLTLGVLFCVDSYAFSDIPAQADENSGKRVVIIDAGHGGEDPGAIGVNGVFEKDLNLAIAKYISEELEARGYKTVLTRNEDALMYGPDENIKGMRKIYDLKNRCKITAEYEYPIFVSIHMNSFGASKYSGLQVWCKSSDAESMSLANSVQGSVRDVLQKDNNRAVKEGKDLYLLEHSSGTPIIIECGFLSNPDECEKLSEKEYQKQLSSAIVCGIIEYMNK